MTKGKLLTLGAMLMLCGLIVTPVARAEDSQDKPLSNSSENKQARTEELKKRVEERKQEIKAQVEAKKTAVREKLSDARKQKCEQRQPNVNRIIKKSNEQSTKHLATFQKIEDRVKQFVTDKNLTVANYDTLVAAADEKQAAAEATLSVSEETTFNCSDTDPSSPGKVVSDLMHTKNDALKAYRSAIKDLIVAVKQALKDSKTTAEGSEQ